MRTFVMDALLSVKLRRHGRLIGSLYIVSEGLGSVVAYGCLVIRNCLRAKMSSSLLVVVAAATAVVVVVVVVLA